MRIKNLKFTTKTAIVLITVLLAIILVSCADNSTTTTKAIGELKQRIIGKEYTEYNGVGYQIIEIDSVEYLSNTIGGVCRLSKNNH